MMTLRSRAWCFTINNDTFDDLEKMLDMTFQYLVFGFETGGKKKVCHIQGYVYFNNALSQSSVKKETSSCTLGSYKGYARSEL